MISATIFSKISSAHIAALSTQAVASHSYVGLNYGRLAISHALHSLSDLRTLLTMEF